MGGMKSVYALVGLLALTMIGCSGGVQSDAPVAEVEDDGVFSVALLTPGPISDSGWNAMAYDGLVAIEDELGATVQNTEVKAAQIRDAMRSYAQKDFELVIGHGYEFNEPGTELSSDFTNTVFVSSSGGMTSENSGTFRFYLEQGFYLAGYVAGKMTETDTIALIGFNSIPSIKSTFRGFIAGAKAANPDIKIIEPNMSLDADAAAIKQQTLAAIDEGADFVIHQANEKAQAVFDACKERGVYAFGANANQNSNPSGAVLASAVIIAKPAYVALAKDVQAGTYKGHVEPMGMKDGTIDLVFNLDMLDKLPNGLADEIEALKEQIKSGELVVPKDEF